MYLHLPHAQRVVGQGEDGAGEIAQVYSSREAAGFERESQEHDEENAPECRHLDQRSPTPKSQGLCEAP